MTSVKNQPLTKMPKLWTKYRLISQQLDGERQQVWEKQTNFDRLDRLLVEV